MLVRRANGRNPTGVFAYNTALWRLMCFVLAGCVFTLAYSLRSWRGGFANFVAVVSVGLMTGGASLSVGGLLGFLFGVPHTREGSRVDTESPASVRPSDKASYRQSSPTYRPNTSLEQISDWLTKMLVGVGLVEIKVIPTKLIELASYVAKGLDDNEQAQVFALSLLVYFTLGGFVFGFLWARLYLPKWFHEADKVDLLEEKVNANSKALERAMHQINPAPTEPPESDQDLVEAIKAASPEIRGQIYSYAKGIYDERSVKQADPKDEYWGDWVRGMLSVVNGLIACDPAERNFEYRLLLSYLLRRNHDLAGALREITKAIEIRDKLKTKGWKWLEFYRAHLRIEQDAKVEKKQRSDAAAVQQITADLWEASSNAENWKKWFPMVKEWTELNLGIADAEHRPSVELITSAR